MLEPKKPSAIAPRVRSKTGDFHVHRFGMAVIGGRFTVGFCDEEYHAECVIGREKGREKCTGHVDVKAVVTELGKYFFFAPESRQWGNAR